MTVEQLIEILETLPKGSIITNEENSELAEVCYEPSEKYPYDLEVWMVFEGDI